jgi:hypothetical protein
VRSNTNPIGRGIITLEQAKPFLEPLANPMKEYLMSEWAWIQEILDQDPVRRVKLDDTSTLASMLSNAFRYTARERMPNECGVKWENTGRMQHGMVGPAIRLRFKKLTNDKSSMNIQTPSQGPCYNEPQMVLDEAQFITSVTFGYTTDRLARDISGVYFVCPNGYAKNHWVWPLFEGDNGQMKIWEGPFDPDGGNELKVVINVGKKGGARKA